MPRITIPSREKVPAAAQSMLDSVEQQLGFVPNVHRLLSIGPNTLAGFL